MSTTKKLEKRLNSHILLAVLATLITLGFSMASGCEVVDECDLSEARCDGNVAIGCQQANGRGEVGTRRITATCAAPTSCFAGDGYAVCALSATPCDPATFVQKCDGANVIVCGYPEGDAEDHNFEVSEALCDNGNTCVAGGCGLPADITCDPATYVPTCEPDKLTLCREMGEFDSGRFRVAYQDNKCTDGNQCFTGPNYGGCGRDGTTCDKTTFAERCEGNTLIRCLDAYQQMIAPPFVGLEYAVPCPTSCSIDNGLGTCK